MPPLEIHVFGYTPIPNPFFGGILFPGIVFTVLYAWPALERRITKDHARHDLLDRPRDNPTRAAIGAAFLSWIATIFVAGAADRILVSVGIPYVNQVWFFRIAAILIPAVVYVTARAICRQLRASEIHPLREWTGGTVRRNQAGGFDVTASSTPGVGGEDSDLPPGATVGR
jgi:ubiquinol-cytochrome c reductase cytochrome b subunit